VELWAGEEMMANDFAFGGVEKSVLGNRMEMMLCRGVLFLTFRLSVACVHGVVCQDVQIIQ
jgi:hypothetical protein